MHIKYLVIGAWTPYTAWIYNQTSYTLVQKYQYLGIHVSGTSCPILMHPRLHLPVGGGCG